MVEMQERLMMCNNGDCVDVSRIVCEEKFNKFDEIIECEQLQSMADSVIQL